MRQLFFSMVCLLLVQPVLAGETPWQEVAPNVRLRLISTGLIGPDGSTRAALEIDMPQTTKTYWRVPGETGLPTEIDFSGSPGVSATRIDWPYPVRDVKSGYLDYVYYGHTILPLNIATAEPEAVLNLTAVLGICSEICIPAQAAFTLPLADPAPDRPNALRIRQTLAEVPILWPDGDTPFASLTWSADKRGLLLELDDPEVEAASLIATVDGQSAVFGAPQKSPQDDLVVLPILGKTDNSALEGLSVSIAFMTSKGPFEVVATPGAPPHG